MKFSHVAHQIFEQLDDQSLVNCKEVAKLWHSYIDNKNLSWIQIVNIPTTLKYNDSYLHLAARKGQTLMFENIFNNEEIKDQKNYVGETPFHIICEHKHFILAEMIVQKYAEVNINLNSKDDYGRTGFHLACINGDLKVLFSKIQRFDFFIFQ